MFSFGRNESGLSKGQKATDQCLRRVTGSLRIYSGWVINWGTWFNIKKSINKARLISYICITTVKAANLMKRCEGTRSTPTTLCSLGRCHYRMFHRTGVHHLLTLLNMASRSTRRLTITTWHCPVEHQAAFLQCTLDPFGARASNIGCQRQIKFLWKGREDSWNIREDICWEQHKALKPWTMWAEVCATLLPKREETFVLWIYA